METIKISVEVSVNLSENTQNFIKSLLCNAATPAPQPVASKPQPSQPVASKPVAPTPKPQPVASKPAPQPVASANANTTKNIEDVRGMLAKKVNEHRSEIKQKLNELGAPSVTKLDPAKYDEMYNFLSAL